LLVVLIGWLTALFVSLGMYSPRHGTIVTVLLVCALSTAAALLLILEMNRPLHGLFKISGEPLRELIQHLGR
jgi:hypothetical protein